MSQNELDEVGDIDTEVATEVEDVEEDNTTSDDEITWEEIHQLRKDSESLRKANKKIAMLEKGNKKSPETVNPANLSEDELDALLEKRDFYKGNSQAKELREEIEAMVVASKWKVDRTKAFELLSGDAEIEENRKVYSRSTVEGGKSNTVGFSPITTAQYDKLSDEQRNSYDEKSLKIKWFIDLK